MATQKMKSTLVVTIPSPTVLDKKLTALNSIAISGNNAYVLKSCGATSDGVLYPIAICKVANFTEYPAVSVINVTKDEKPAKIARHANDITMAGSYFFVATMNTADEPQLVKISSKGVVIKEYLYIKNEENSTFHTCSYIGNKKFIVGVANSDGRNSYDIAHIEEDNLVYSGITFYSQPIPDDFTSNATYYSRDLKKFYTTFFTRDSEGKIQRNYTYCYKIDTFTDGVELTPAHEFIIDAPSDYDKKFEVEGVILSDTTKYIACNCDSTKGSIYKYDGIFKLKKK